MRLYLLAVSMYKYERGIKSKVSKEVGVGKFVEKEISRIGVGNSLSISAERYELQKRVCRT